MKQTIFGVIVITLFFVSCSHKSGHYKFEGNLLYTMDMREGSYWVFRDSITHSIDTLKYKFISWGSPRNGDYYSNQIRSYEFSNEQATNSYRSIKFEFHADAESRSIAMNATYSIHDTILIKTVNMIVYQEPFNVGKIKSIDTGYTKLLSTYPEYELLSKKYLTVFHTGQFYWDTLQPYPNNLVWYSMHDKVIKLRMQTHDRLVVLELIDHKIVR